MKNKNEKYLPLFISLGLVIGGVFGIILGTIFEDFGLWLPIGVGGGIALGSLSFLLLNKK